MKKLSAIVISTSLLTLSGCMSTGEKHQANVFKANQVNSQQEVKVVNIIAILPAKVEVSNKENKQAAQTAGAIFGAILGAAVNNNQRNSTLGGNALAGAVGGAVGGATGSLVSDTTLVDGVSLTYKDVESGKVLNSAQVGLPCEYKTGEAIMISTSDKETRIQPNATCPKEKEA